MVYVLSLRHSVSGVTPSTYFAILFGSSVYFLLDAKYVSTIFFFTFAQASINLHKIKFMKVKYYINQGSHCISM